LITVADPISIPFRMSLYSHVPMGTVLGALMPQPESKGRRRTRTEIFS
jgi:hypothetical protein